jgi:hypothetical protein
MKHVDTPFDAFGVITLLFAAISLIGGLFSFDNPTGWPDAFTWMWRWVVLSVLFYIASCHYRKT